MEAICDGTFRNHDDYKAGILCAFVQTDRVGESENGNLSLSNLSAIHETKMGCKSIGSEKINLESDSIPGN